MTAKEYLEQLEILNTVINQKIEELHELKTDSINVGAIDYSKDRVQGGKQGNPVQDAVSRFVDLENTINDEIDQYANSKHLLINQIQQLHNNNYIQILFKKYVQFKTLNKVSEEMNMSYDYIRELHKKALHAFSDMHANLEYFIKNPQKPT